MGSGKDSVGAKVMDSFNTVRWEHLSFGDELKSEVTLLLRILQDRTRGLVGERRLNDGEGFPQVLHDLVKLSRYTKEKYPLFNNVPYTDLIFAFAGLNEHSTSGRDVDGWTRSASIRRVLQFWGTDVRRRLDSDYWAKKVAVKAEEVLASGRSVLVTDARFPNEAITINQIPNSFLLRLDASPEVRIERVSKRDSIVPSEDSLHHASETALDDYTNFDLRIDTDPLTLPAVVNQVRNALVGKFVEEA